MARNAVIFFALGLAFSQRATAQVRVAPSREEMAAIRGSDSNQVGMKVRIPSLQDRSAGLWSSDGGVSTWTLNVQADDGDGVIVYFDELILPPGAGICARSEDGSFATRTFRRNDNRLAKSFALPALPSPRVIVEATVPFSLVDEFRAVVSRSAASSGRPVSARKTSATRPAATSTSIALMVNPGSILNVPLSTISTPREETSVTAPVRSSITRPRIVGTCFDSAQHCAMQATPAELGQAIFYFNYEAPGCENPSSPEGLLDQSVVGCARLAASGGMHPLPPDGSDFHLFELSHIPPEYNVYYAGWNRNDCGPGSHAGGDHSSSTVGYQEDLIHRVVRSEPDVVCGLQCQLHPVPGYRGHHRAEFFGCRGV